MNPSDSSLGSTTILGQVAGRLFARINLFDPRSTFYDPNQLGPDRIVRYIALTTIANPVGDIFLLSKSGQFDQLDPCWWLASTKQILDFGRIGTTIGVVVWNDDYVSACQRCPIGLMSRF